MIDEPFEPLPPDLAAALAHARAACGDRSLSLQYRSEVTSTNDVVARLASTGAAEGTTVIADRQTAGRGRHGRTWHSPPGAGLYMSVLFRPAEAAGAPDSQVDEDTALITLLAGVAASEALEATTGLRVDLKWPNDLVVEKQDPGGLRRLKVGGILAEGVAIGTLLHHVVLGIGINLRPSAYPPDIRDRATSIEEEVGRGPDRGALVAHLLIGLMQGRAELQAGRAHVVLQRWRDRATASIGREVQWDTPRGRLRGLTRGIDESGALLVDAGGDVHRIVAGEVTWL